MDDNANAFDRTLHAGMAELARGLSPAAMMLAWSDWAIHLASQPARSAQVLAVRPLMRAIEAAGEALQPVQAHGRATPDAHAEDRRLDDPAWDTWPFSLYRDAFRSGGRWLGEVTQGVPGVERHHDQVVAFSARQLHAMCSPANSPATHPLVLQKTLASGGMNLMQGAGNWMEDFQRILDNRAPVGAEAFIPGQGVALTPGKVILRNRLMELIQYAPTTATVHPEPVLVMGAWIMKYYILDLSPHNSLIRYLVDRGHTVFAISWKNPDPQEDRDLGLNDYLSQGLMASIDAISAIAGKPRVHALGYCLGGTLLAIGAAAMARDKDDRLATVTLLAAQTDFTEPGELGLFIDESQLSFMEDLMARQGCLKAEQMAGAFNILRSIDRIWTPMVQNYLLGERAPLTDLMAWNADGTRMPYRMHADYLRHLFYDNDLAQGRYAVGGQPISLRDIEVPIFAVGTVTDNVAPWRSVYKLNLLCDTEVRFVLTDGGHNGGIVSEPGHAHRSYRVLQRAGDSPYVPPDAFLARAEHVQGSWWPALQDWLAAHSGPRRKPPRIGNAQRGYAPVCDAPGTYVLVR